ncbi:hypothetical protein, partial [Mesorhizobium sp.]|uniref:hypothetical protein n=1 Tax=Mesorhizobium sp. TaxID=1871066 RepID=UPI0025C2B548
MKNDTWRAIAAGKTARPAIDAKVCHERWRALPWAIGKQLPVGGEQSHHFREPRADADIAT